MEYKNLPNTDIQVSKICLGTMTWGRQNSQDEAFEQMNYSVDRGVNFFDTAELYPVPASPDKYALTEKIIGNWFQKFKKRDEVILATSATVEGQTTAYYIQDSLKNSNAKVTKLAQGLPVGGEIESLDDGTLFSAFKNRSKLNSNSD